MKAFKLIGEYLYLRKKTETDSDNKMIRVMHRINRISLLLFLLCLMILISKFITQAVLNR
jgi:hypothetical protein